MGEYEVGLKFLVAALGVLSMYAYRRGVHDGLILGEKVARFMLNHTGASGQFIPADEQGVVWHNQKAPAERVSPEYAAAMGATEFSDEMYTEDGESRDDYLRRQGMI